MQVLKKFDDWERRTGYFQVKTKFIYLDDAGNDKLLHWLLLPLVCWLMLARRLCVYNAGLKVAVSWEILTVIMTSYYENVWSCKIKHSSLWRVLFLAIHFALSWPRDSPLWVLITNDGPKHLTVCFWGFIWCSILTAHQEPHLIF